MVPGPAPLEVADWGSFEPRMSHFESPVEGVWGRSCFSCWTERRRARATGRIRCGCLRASLPTSRWPEAGVIGAHGWWESQPPGFRVDPSGQTSKKRIQASQARFSRLRPTRGPCGSADPGPMGALHVCTAASTRNPGGWVGIQKAACGAGSTPLGPQPRPSTPNPIGYPSHPWGPPGDWRSPIPPGSRSELLWEGDWDRRGNR